jgi:hypothetical protein
MHMTSRIKKIGFTTAAGLGLFVGVAGLSAAATGSNDPAPDPAGVEAPGPDLEEPGDTGVNCENGIDTATGAECDGGPAAAEADEATEAPDAEDDEAEGVGDEADDGVDHQFEGEEVGENGDGVPDADDLNGSEVDD